MNIEVKRSDKICEKHNRQLVICPVNACSTCDFSPKCNDHQFCSYCVDEINDKIKEQSQKIYFDEFKPAANKKYKLGKLYKQLKGEVKGEDDSPDFLGRLYELEKKFHDACDEVELIRRRMK